MLFSMGFGSRMSRYIQKNLLDNFIYIEFTLSILVGFSALIAYTAASYMAFVQLVIYLLSIAIGFLIGMEIPLAVRINDSYESLRTNVSSVLENDYYGSLIGGLFFAFIGLPVLTLTYTPFLLGLINFLVAILLYIQLSPDRKKNKFIIQILIISVIFAAGVFFAKPIIIFGQQQRYKDKVVFQKQSKYQNVVITQWKDNFWLYIDGNQQLSSFDEVMYHEPIVHPVMQLHPHPENILVLGGGDGCAVREILKYSTVKQIILVDIDSVMTNIGKYNPIITNLNKGSLLNPLVKIINTDAFSYIENNDVFFDIIIIDLPDPKSAELNRLYSSEFYSVCNHRLRQGGYIITQAGSPYFATNAFLCVQKTLESAKFRTLLLHNQVITMGEWGWVIGAKNAQSGKELRERLLRIDYSNIETVWLNKEANLLMTSFGKDFYIGRKDDSIQVNTINDPVLMKYYKNGNWDIY